MNAGLGRDRDREMMAGITRAYVSGLGKCDVFESIVLTNTRGQLYGLVSVDLREHKALFIEYYISSIVVILFNFLTLKLKKRRF